ncbi:MAG: aminopeptidase P family protein [Tissierellia bacterium]|nr:aminopeptidase P family protein [Tissierellia bacterium]
MIIDKLTELRQMMQERNIDAYIVTTSDPHQSEYLADYYKTREFITGFSGSYGTFVITENKAGLWTDSRYFIQAERQLEYSTIELYKMGVKGQISYEEFLKNEVNEFGKIGFNGECFSISEYKSLSEKMGNRMLISDLSYVEDMWKNRPSLPDSKIWIYDQKYTGESLESKLKRLRKIMKERDYDYTFIAAPEDICYLLNIRGDDVSYNPIVLSYMLISQNRAYLCIDQSKLDDDIKEYFAENNIKIQSYNYIYDLLRDIKGQSRIYLDPKRTNVNIYESINSNVRIITGTNLVTQMKAIKNKIELSNEKKAYLTDCKTLIKFFRWVETGVITGNLTESLASKKLLDLRKQNKNFIEESFETIAAYKENAAIVHYSPTRSISKTLKNSGLFLVDSGAHYLEGTTDITRTIVLGELTDKEKEDYTIVLKSLIMLSKAIFKEGTNGQRLDAFCKYQMWQNKRDYFHGTGHGIGFSLTVHEGPQSISQNSNVIFRENMTSSIEPGIYVENSHGIRLENEVYVKEIEENEFGKFLGFETLTFLPIDTRAIKKDMLNDDEIEWLNNYNTKCREELSPLLEGGDLQYLEMMTKEI